MGLFFGLFKYMGMLRVTSELEKTGLDLSYHGGSAYESHKAHLDEGRRSTSKEGSGSNRGNQVTVSFSPGTKEESNEQE